MSFLWKHSRNFELVFRLNRSFIGFQITIIFVVLSTRPRINSSVLLLHCLPTMFVVNVYDIISVLTTVITSLTLEYIFSTRTIYTLHGVPRQFPVAQKAFCHHHLTMIMIGVDGEQIKWSSTWTNPIKRLSTNKWYHRSSCTRTRTCAHVMRSRFTSWQYSVAVWASKIGATTKLLTSWIFLFAT